MKNEIKAKYQALISTPNLKQHEIDSIFAEIDSGINIEGNKEKLFNAFFKLIYRAATRAVSVGYHNNLDEIISFITTIFYRSIDNYKENGNACFYTYISKCIHCSEKSSWKLGSSIPNSVPLSTSPNRDGYFDDITSEKIYKRIEMNHADIFASGVNIIDEIEKTDYIDEIERFVSECGTISEKEKDTFFEMYRLGESRVSTLRNVASKMGVSYEMVRLRTNKVKEKIRLYFEDKELSYGL